MRILFIATFPPPITGQSVVSKAFLDGIKNVHEVSIVNMSKSNVSIGFTKRILEILSVIAGVIRNKNNVDLIYFTISESLLGNIKDLIIYLVCLRKLSKVYIHLHGGSIKKLLWDKYPIIYWVNKKVISKIGGAIVSGNSHKEVFDKILPNEKIFVIPNFASEELFMNNESIIEKFSKSECLHILYISGMKKKKGYEELLCGYLQLSDEIKKKIKLDFAGEFVSVDSENEFKSKIQSEKNIKYYGIVSDAEKISLFAKSNVFCLPTTFFEGQPVSVLEAYASGCIVVTTAQSGILDVFHDGENGYLLKNFPLSNSIAEILKYILFLPIDNKISIALLNAEYARNKFRLTPYILSLKKAMGLI